MAKNKRTNFTFGAEKFKSTNEKVRLNSVYLTMVLIGRIVVFIFLASQFRDSIAVNLYFQELLTSIQQIIIQFIRIGHYFFWHTV